MPIFISKERLLNYHNEFYVAPTDSQDIKSHIEINGTGAISTLANIWKHIGVGNADDERRREIEMSSLDIDAKSFEQSLELNRNQIMLDQKVQGFINSQRLHRANFLNDIRQRGLKLKNNLSEEKTPKSLAPLNY